MDVLGGSGGDEVVVVALPFSPMKAYELKLQRKLSGGKGIWLSLADERGLWMRN